jgi:hypothetical protein
MSVNFMCSTPLRYTSHIDSITEFLLEKDEEATTERDLKSCCALGNWRKA